jgi:predicted type IV restriction endonuclease
LGVELQELVARIQSGLDAGRYPNERAVSTSIVVPILRALGWDDSDPAQVMPEYANPRGRVDYALAIQRNSPSVFIEVKQVGKSADADRQLFEYAFHEGVPIAVLTDGRLWNFYLPGQQGSYEDRRIYLLDIVERDVSETVHRFKRYLARDRVASGEAFADAQFDYRAGASRREAEQTLPRAWAQILGEPDGMLLEIVRDRTEALCGHKPDDDTLEFFIKSQLGSSPATTSIGRLPRMRVIRETIENAPPQIENTPLAPPSEGKRNQWRVGTRMGSERNGTDTFVAFLSALFELYPERRDTMAASVQTRGRNNISRVVEEIYPNRPEIARKNHRPLPGGWFVGTNESSGTKAIIMTKAAKAAGLAIGKDAEFEL